MPAHRTANTRKPAPPARRGGSAGIWLFLAIIIPAGIFVLPTALLFGLGLIPTFVAYIVDSDPEKTAPMTVGSINFCGVLPFALELWQDGHSLNGALQIMGNPLSWLVMYGAAGAGWLFYSVIPAAIASVEVMRAEAKVESLQDKKRNLAKEWGPEVSAED